MPAPLSSGDNTPLPHLPALLCLGGSNLDRKLRTLGEFVLGTSNPVSQYESLGGVARNIAENLARLTGPGQVGLLSALGDDTGGQAILQQAHHLGLDTTACLQISGRASDSYTAVLNQAGEMLLALAHMELVEELTPTRLAAQSVCASAQMWIADMNLPAASLAWLLQQARDSAQVLLLVAVSQSKMARLPADLRGCRLLLANRDEVAALLGLPSLAEADLAAACGALRARGVQDVVVTLGERGVACSSGQTLLHLPAPALSHIEDVTGAGDAFAAAVAWSLWQQPDDLRLACRRGLTLAAQTLQCATTVAANISPTMLAELIN